MSEKTLHEVVSELKGRICYCANYRDRGSGYGRIIAVLEDAKGNRWFDVYRGGKHCGRYIYPQKGEVEDDGGNVIKSKTIVRVPRNQARLEAKVVFMNRDGVSHGRDLRHVARKQVELDPGY